VNHRDAFGRLLADPAALTFAERVDCLRRLQGRLAAAPAEEERWLARALRRMLDGEDDDLLRLLDLRPPRGSRRTVAAVVDQERVDIARLNGTETASRSSLVRAKRRRDRSTSWGMTGRTGT
jgi:hypothetical protein